VLELCRIYVRTELGAHSFGLDLNWILYTRFKKKACQPVNEMAGYCGVAAYVYQQNAPSIIALFMYYRFFLH
jgi:hypothetical protein